MKLKSLEQEAFTAYGDKNVTKTLHTATAIFTGSKGLTVWIRLIPYIEGDCEVDLIVLKDGEPELQTTYKLPLHNGAQQAWLLYLGALNGGDELQSCFAIGTIERLQTPNQLLAERRSHLVKLTKAVRKADQLFEDLGGSSRHWVSECFLPCLEEEGLRVTTITLP
jgi:hypothetical protein